MEYSEYRFLDVDALKVFAAEARSIHNLFLARSNDTQIDKLQSRRRKERKRKEERDFRYNRANAVEKEINFTSLINILRCRVFVFFF